MNRRTIKTSTRKISEVKKEVNRLNELGKKGFIIETDLELDTVQFNKKDRIFLNQLVAMATDMGERKQINFNIVVSYGKRRLSPYREGKIKGMVEQISHQLDFTNVTFKIKVLPEKGEIFTTSNIINIIENNSTYLTIGSAE